MPETIDTRSQTTDEEPFVVHRSSYYVAPMRIRTWLFAAFVIVPAVEIVLFYYVGSWIGIGPTILTVIVTAALGSYFVAKQGRFTWNAIRTKLNRGEVPAASLVHGAMILVAGALLLTPGFLTDFVGFALLVPGVREAIRQWGLRRFGSEWVTES
ncbi:MAG: FxsA family protein [Actinomycetota bacterium]